MIRPQDLDLVLRPFDLRKVAVTVMLCDTARDMLARLLRTRWYRLLGVGPLVMLLALAPSVLYVDHWMEYWGLTASQAEENALEHVVHCHITPANCSDQPLPPDLSATPAVVHVVEPELTSVALEENVGTMREYIVAPPTEPPRA